MSETIPEVENTARTRIFIFMKSVFPIEGIFLVLHTDLLSPEGIKTLKIFCNSQNFNIYANLLNLYHQFIFIEKKILYYYLIFCKSLFGLSCAIRNYFVNFTQCINYCQSLVLLWNLFHHKPGKSQTLFTSCLVFNFAKFYLHRY